MPHFCFLYYTFNLVFAERSASSLYMCPEMNPLPKNAFSDFISTQRPDSEYFIHLPFKIDLKHSVTPKHSVVMRITLYGGYKGNLKSDRLSEEGSQFPRLFTKLLTKFTQHHIQDTMNQEKEFHFLCKRDLYLNPSSNMY